MANANNTLSARLADLSAAQVRAKFPALSEIPAAALKKPLTFVVDGFSESAKGGLVMNGTVTHKGTKYRSAIFGEQDILAILGDVAVSEATGKSLTGTFHRTSEGGVFYRRPRKAATVTPAEAMDTAEDIIG
jgi:hypothetical protein